jgi:recombinational DNA repair protein RecR
MVLTKEDKLFISEEKKTQAKVNKKKGKKTPRKPKYKNVAPYTEDNYIGESKNKEYIKTKEGKKTIIISKDKKTGSEKILTTKQFNSLKKKVSIIESTKKFNGLYFILGGTVGTMKKEDISQLRIEELKKRVSQNNFTEIIVALNPTPEGRTTSVLVEQNIKEVVPSPNFRITHLARGIPVGGELEYIDEETLESALEERK